VADGKAAGEVKELYAALSREGGSVNQFEPTLAVLRKALKRDGGLYRIIASADAEAGVKGEIAILARARDAVESILPASEEKAETDQKELLAFSRMLLSVCQQCLERYEQRKLETGRLDFEDLQLKTRALLKRQGVRKYLAQRFKFIMVDEYQDTNQLQYDILRPLLNDLSTGNLFIVGDPKQSIYGFRDANVAVFEQTCRDIVATEVTRISGGQVVLGESFRPLADLAAFVNLVFARIMGSASDVQGEYEVGYESLFCARTNNAPGRVELLVGTADAARVSTEPERIALRIGALVGSRYRIFDSNEQPKEVRFRDIAVLLRSRSLLPELEIAFVRAGIPYVVSGGVGYFQTQDILDFYSYLRFLDHPADDVALAGILRSPFFSVSDIELFEVAVHGRRRSLWEDLCAQLSRGQLPPALAEAVAALQVDLAVGLRIPVPEILSRIVAKRLFLAKIAGTPRGAQAQANLEKLQRMARSFDVQGFSTLFDFVQRLRRLIDEEEDEGQGMIESQTDAVQVMTVHAAKGLEFPVVVLPNIDRRYQYDHEPFLDDRLGVAFARLTAEGDSEDYPLTELLREESRRRTLAEEKRVFYVACTRARDMLILSGNERTKRTTPSWMSWLLDAIDAPEILDTERLSYQCMMGVLRKVNNDFVLSQEPHLLTLHVVRADSVAQTVTPRTPASAMAEAPEAFATPIPAQWKGEIFSATRIKTYRECPAHYYLRYILGMPPLSGAFARGEDDEQLDREYPAELRGRLFHAIMEKIDRLDQSGPELEFEIRRALALETPIDDVRAPALIAETAAAVRSVTKSAFWREVLLGEDTHTEFTVSSVLGNDYLSGTMDRVYRGTGGVWNVLDYKTDRVDASSVGAKAKSYWPQLQFYALLAHRYFKTSRVRTTLLFTSLVDVPLHQEYEAGDLLAFESEIQETIAKIRNGIFAPGKIPCPVCPFQPEGCTFLLSR
jgi:ATP-dependent helicase/nuclease subunit A